VVAASAVAAVGCRLHWVGDRFFASSSVSEVLASALFIYPAVAGVCVASTTAELYLLRGTPRRTRTADLSTREFGDYANTSDQIAMAATFVAAVLVAAWAALSVDAAQRSWVTCLAIVAAIVVAAAHLMQRRVVQRRRPAVSSELREADDLLRSLAASRGIARPAISFGFVTLGLALAPTEHQGFEALAWLVGLGCWWFNRGLGIDRFIAKQLQRTSARSA